MNYEKSEKYEVLKRYFGYDSFREGQEILIDGILDGRDVLGIMLDWGVDGVWMVLFADWAVRAVLFYWRMVTGRWLWKYPRSEPQKCEKKPVVSE